MLSIEQECTSSATPRTTKHLQLCLLPLTPPPILGLNVIQLQFSPNCLILILTHPPLQPSHLPRLQLTKILPSQVHPPDLITHAINPDILLLAPSIFTLLARRLLHGLSPERRVGLFEAVEAEGVARAEGCNFYSGELGGIRGLEGGEGVPSEVDVGSI